MNPGGMCIERRCRRTRNQSPGRLRIPLLPSRIRSRVSLSQAGFSRIGRRDSFSAINNERYRLMPWCPGCSCEYKRPRRECPECGQPLSRGPGFTEPLSYRRRFWFTVRTVRDSAQAETLRSFLEANGYDVVVRNGNGLARGRKRASGRTNHQVHILIPADEAREAARLLCADKESTEDEHPAFAGVQVEPETHEDYDYQDDYSDIIHSNGLSAILDDEDFAF
jgi:hypothetical protein